MSGNGRSPPGAGGATTDLSPPGSVRFERVELRYGCHARCVELYKEGVPFVILGPNGAGKTTIVEAAVRTLYGFNRHKPLERRELQERRPWEGESYTAALWVAGPWGRVTIERDFDTGEVVVREQGDAAVRGDAVVTDGKGYREFLERYLGLTDFDSYVRTAFIDQEGLTSTRLSQDLLQLAAGGHADVHAARRTILDAYHALTTEPIAEGESRKRKKGERERAREELEELEARLKASRAAQARRQPLVEERDRVRARLEALDQEIDQLEDAFQGLSKLQMLTARRQASGERVRRFEEAHRELDEALARLDLRVQQPRSASPPYPEDFQERVAALTEGLWPRREALEARREERRRALERATANHGPEAWLVITGWSAWLAAGVAALAGTVVAVLGRSGFLILSFGVAAAVLATAGWLARRRRLGRYRRLERELEEVEAELENVDSRIRERLAGVPDADTLGPETCSDRLREFQRQREEARLEEDARKELRGAMDRARGVLEAVEAQRAEGSAPSATGAAVPRAETLVARARELLRRLQEELSRERNDSLAPLQLEFRDVSATQFTLPDGVRAETHAMQAALLSRRQERTELQSRREEIVASLAYEGRPDEGPVAIETRIREARAHLEAVERRVAAYRWAFELINRAYDDFRRTDQERLLEGISVRLAQATGGELGPVRSDEELTSARVLSNGRMLALTSPPLSYGQLHSVLLAIRLGVADFLAEYGVWPPLLLDDPFVHLDAERARELWDVLCRIATERQVVVLTQDHLLLEFLGVRPDLLLSG